MRALLWLDPGAATVTGHVVQGHIVQAERTAAALRSTQGVEAIVSSDEAVDVQQFDVVHSLGASRQQLRRARLAGIPVAVSTIYWSADYVIGETALGSHVSQLASQFTRRARVAQSVLRRGAGPTASQIWRPLVERALYFETADLLLPNSYLEAAAIAAELDVTTPMHVVPNGVDPEVFYPRIGESDRGFVLCVGRFEPHKNQLGLIHAMKRLPYPLKLVGPAHPHHSDYFDACQRAASSRVTFEVATSHEGLRAIYQSARVHVLPSFFETTGLVSLEAALSGCNVATTDRGFAREYFGEHATYLDPSNSRSIAAAVEAAWHRSDASRLQKHVLENYTWAAVAEATNAGYELLLAR